MLQSRMAKSFYLISMVLGILSFEIPMPDIPKNLPPCFAKARDYHCNTAEKIECQGPLGNCKCEDGSTCMWTNIQAVTGCPCKKSPKNQDYSFIEKAKEFGCDDQQFECKGPICNCSCLDKSKCIWAKDKVIAGCPCQDKKVWDVPEEPPLSKEEIKQRRAEREEKRKQREKEKSQSQQQPTKSRSKEYIEDI